MSEDPERRKLFEDVQMLFAGHPAERAGMVATDVFINVIGFISDSPEDADELLEELLVEMKKMIRTNWTKICEARARGMLEVGNA